MTRPKRPKQDRTTAFSALAAGVLLAVTLASSGCGTSKPEFDGGGSGSGGSSGGGGNSGSGGLRFDANNFDLNLDGFSLDGFSLDGFNLDAILADLNIKTCPAGTKSGDTCATGVDTACTEGGTACACLAGKWSCFGS